jgi:hypothetical protein
MRLPRMAVTLSLHKSMAPGERESGGAGVFPRAAVANAVAGWP